jgi:hypothetical protein
MALEYFSPWARSISWASDPFGRSNLVRLFLTMSPPTPAPGASGVHRRALGPMRISLHCWRPRLLHLEIARVHTPPTLPPASSFVKTVAARPRHGPMPA